MTNSFLYTRISSQALIGFKQQKKAKKSKEKTKKKRRRRGRERACMIYHIYINWNYNIKIDEKLTAAYRGRQVLVQIPSCIIIQSSMSNSKVTNIHFCGLTSIKVVILPISKPISLQFTTMLHLGSNTYYRQEASPTHADASKITGNKATKKNQQRRGNED